MNLDTLVSIIIFILLATTDAMTLGVSRRTDIGYLNIIEIFNRWS